MRIRVFDIKQGSFAWKGQLTKKKYLSGEKEHIYLNTPFGENITKKATKMSNIQLFAEEDFIVSGSEDKTLLKLSDEQINEKYNRGEIRIVTEQARYPLDTIESMLDSKKYNLNPEYQRRKRWDNIRKSRLIESFIMNVPIPPIFLYEVNYSEYEVMDGLQRLTAIYDFYKGRYELDGLEYWSDLNGRRYNTLPEQIKKGIDRRYLSSVVLLQETAKSNEEAESLKQIVFERLNSGGEKLMPQETRNALHGGAFNSMCIELAKNDKFRSMWKIPLDSATEDELLANESYRKMEDVELVLRFFAYRHINQLKGITVEKFLDRYLRYANGYSKEMLNKLRIVFLETVNLVFDILGENAFLLPAKSGQNYRSPVKTIYDPMMQAFSKYIDKRERLIRSSDAIRENLYASDARLQRAEKQVNPYMFDGRYTNSNDVQARIKFFVEYIDQFVA